MERNTSGTRARGVARRSVAQGTLRSGLEFRVPVERRGVAARRGMSFLEVVLALAILAMIAATSLAAISAITGQARAARHKLAATELANRLILQYMDDPTRMPRAELPIEYARERYRWSLREGSVSMVPVVAPEERTTNGPRRMDRFKTVSVQVWLSEESGGRMVPDEGTPGAVLTRLMDPYALRNPDAIDRLVGDKERLREFLDAFSGGAPSAPPSEAPPGRNSGAGARPASGGGK